MKTEQEKEDAKLKKHIRTIEKRLTEIEKRLNIDKLIQEKPPLPSPVTVKTGWK